MFEKEDLMQLTLRYHKRTRFASYSMRGNIKATEDITDSHLGSCVARNTVQMRYTCADSAALNTGRASAAAISDHEHAVIGAVTSRMINTRRLTALRVRLISIRFMNRAAEPLSSYVDSLVTVKRDKYKSKSLSPHEKRMKPLVNAVKCGYGSAQDRE